VIRARLAAIFDATGDARPLALFRILFGLTLLGDVVDRLADFRVFYTDEGILPRRELALLIGKVRLASLVGAPWTSAVFFAFGAIAAIAFVLGVRARLAAVALWLFELTLLRRNSFVCDGGDLVMIVLAFWSIFADVDAAWSLRRGPRRLARMLPQRVLELQVALIYLTAGVAKTGVTWRHGDAIYFALQLNSVSRPLGMALLGWPAVCRVLTFASRGLELGYALFVLAPRAQRVTRPLAALSATAFHVGIALFMRVGMFPFVMIAAQAPLIPASWLARIERRLHNPQAGTPPPSAPPPSRSRNIVYALVVAQLALVAWSLTPLPRPDFVSRELMNAGVAQDWTMFAPDVLREDGYFTAQALLDDGAKIDPLPSLAPGLLPRTTTYSRWFKLRESLASDERVQVMMARYFCRRLPRMTELTLVYHARRTHAPDEPPQPFDIGNVLVRRCER
jgi:hypothetical protein